MFRTQPSLLARLRRHRGLWLLTALVLVFKLASGSVCLADSSSIPLAAHGPADVTTVVNSTQAPTDTAPDPACLLGEVQCHCTCAHAMPIPTAVASTSGVSLPAFALPPVLAGIRVATLDSPLRPPIA